MNEPSKSHSHSQTQITIGLVVYIITGVLQPIIIDYLRIHNLLGQKFLLLPTLANATGMALCGLLASSTAWETFRGSLKRSHKLKKMVLLTSTVDLLSGMCLTYGLLLTGGAIFVVLYNSCPAWTAILSRFVLGKKLSSLQVSGVILVCIGLIVNVFGSQLQLNEQEKQEHQGLKMNDDGSGVKNASYFIIVGSAIVLLGSLLHSLMFVLSDLTMSSLHLDCDDKKNERVLHSSSVTGEICACCLGTLETVFMTLWVIMGITMYGFNDDNATAVNFERAHYHQAVIGFLALILIDAVHAVCFFTLLKNLGAVASALLKGVQAIVVVALSAMFYCPTEKSQCLTWIKAISAIIVLSGVTGYGFASKQLEILPRGNGSSRHDSRSRLLDSRENSFDIMACETQGLL